MFQSPHSPTESPKTWLILGLALLAIGLIDLYLRPTPAPAPAAAPAPAVATVGTTIVTPTTILTTSVPLATLSFTTPRVQATAGTDGTLTSLALMAYAKAVNSPKGYDLLGPNAPVPTTIFSGWRATGLATPSAATPWQVVSQSPTRTQLTFTNPTGQTFTRTLTLAADGYTWQQTDTVTNAAALPLTLTHVAKVQRQGTHPKGEASNFVNFFGLMGEVTEKEDVLLVEEDYNDTKKAGRTEVRTGTGGWWGITDQYFMAAIVPPSDTPTQRQFGYTPSGTTDDFDATVAQAVTIAPGATATVQRTFYVGPKSDQWLKPLGLRNAISWGWFAVIVRPLHDALVWLHSTLGNWGLAIVALTLALKIVLFPLANKGYASMAQLKKLQPEVEKLKEKYGKDQQQMATQMLALYQKEKVSPLGGCWPMLIQMPIFFAMYKVVLISFELRHAPLAGWITDLSVADPYFVLPILMGITMWLQMRMNPPPTDETQRIVFQFMPIMFTGMMLFFPAGLVFYWAVNNLLSIAQQWLVSRQTT